MARKTNPMSDYDSALSGLTAAEREELVRLMHKTTAWTKKEKARKDELRAKLNLISKGE